MAANTNMHNLTTLIKRLEAATSRLEDMATSIDSSHPSTVAAISSSVGAYTDPSTATPPSDAQSAEPLPPSIEDFDKLLDQHVKAFLKASEEVGGLVEQQARAVAQAFAAERTYLYVTTKAKKPGPQPPELLTELHTCTGTIDELRETNRASPLFTHLSAISEGIVALGWIVESRPADFVKHTLGGVQYYGNKVLKDFKDKDKSHVEYIQAYYRIFHELIAYIKQHYPTGLTWNKDGIEAMEALKQIQSGVASPATHTTSGPPPPPPLPSFDNNGAPPAPPLPQTANGTGQGSDMSAVFEQLNQGPSVTAGLRKVDKSEMTHKNPSLRAGSTVPDGSGSQTSLSSTNSRGKSPVPSKKPKPDNMRTKKPPRRELDGNKWIVENFENTGPHVVEIPAQRSQSILISGCKKCIVKVTSKANAISIDNCTGLSLLVDSLVSSLDVIKSPKFQLQVDGVVPTVLLDQVDGATLYLGPQSLSTEIFSSKSTSVNIVLPPKEGLDVDDKEYPLPEQIRSMVRDGVVVSEVVEHAG